MWQDALVTMFAIGAMAMLGRRWFRARKHPAGAPPACASCAHGQKPKSTSKSTSGVVFR